jgi:hypothetical protein
MWLRDQTRDPDVAAATAGFLARTGHGSMADAALEHPDDVKQLAAALQEMVGFIPDSHLQRAEAKVRKDD